MNIFQLNKKQVIVMIFVIILIVVCIVVLQNIFFEPVIFKKQNGEGLVINEYVTSNYNTWRDDSWNSPDWIELYNSSDRDIWLGDIYISDDAENPEKDLLPDVTLKPGEYFLVFASGGAAEGECTVCHVSFKLGQGDLHLVLSQNQNMLDVQEIEVLPTDISKGRTQDNGWAYFATPTPYGANITEPSDTMDIAPVWARQKDVIINEYMTHNVYIATGEHANIGDWIELYNSSDAPVNIGTMFLSDNDDIRNKFKLPDYDMQPDEYLIINLSEYNDNNDAFTAPFGLSGGDNVVVLTDQSGYDLDIMDVHDLPEGVSAGIGQDGTFGFFDTPTPGQLNSENLSLTMNITAKRSPTSGIVINEFMSNNKYGILDEFGRSSDWIELYNPTDADVHLRNFGLSDDDAEPLKWQFPDDAVIPAKGYLVVFASGMDITEGSEYHTNFNLSTEDEILLLTEPTGATADSMIVEELPGNVSKGKDENGDIVYYAIPTPGRENITHPIYDLAMSADFVLNDLYISEVSASRNNLHRINYSLAEYIEIYNGGPTVINLAGYSICDTIGSEFFFDDISINPDSYLLLVTKGYRQTNVPSVVIDDFRVNGSGETLVLKDSSGNIIDSLNTGYTLGSYSFGRSANDKYSQVFFGEKTPGKQNSPEEFVSVCSKPTFSVQGGVISSDTVEVSLNAHEGETILYTLNGDEPTLNSKTYTQPLVISENTVIRAIAVGSDKMHSAVTASTYIFDKTHDIPIVCLSSNSYGLFSYNYGIYADGDGKETSEFPYIDANFWWDEERKVSFEYYETDGKLALEFNAGIQIFGGFSRAQPQKSFVIHMRDEYGLDEVYYPFFEGSDVTVFKDFLLRNGGQDTHTKLKDYFISTCAIEEGNQDAMRGRPVAVYINGDYWGLYNLREKLNADYIAAHYDLDPDDINIIAASGVAIHGNNEDWEALKQFCRENDFSIQENYDKLAEWVDIENFTDYIIFQTFFSNTDSGNIKFWRDNSETSKWRILFYDVDLTLRPISYHKQMIRRIFGIPNSYIAFSTHVMNAMIQNEGYREYFLQRYAYYLTEVFTDEYLAGGIQDFADAVDSEMLYQTKRWAVYGTYNNWVNHVNEFKDMATGRAEIVVELLRDFLEIGEDRMKELVPWYQP